MTIVTAALVKELRARTALGMMDCKKALQKADGDLDKAIETLRKSSALKAASKAGRTAANGLLGVKVSEDGSRAAMIEVNVETDFAALNSKFIAFLDHVLNAAYDSRQSDVMRLLVGNLEAEREALVQEIGENITLRRIAVMESQEGHIVSYLHGDKRKAALVEIVGGDPQLGRDIAMHITAINPLVVSASEVPATLLEKEREIYSAQAQNSGKAADIVAKMVQGRVRKFLAEVSLLEQPFVKDPAITVANLVAANSAEILRFVRYEVGEGIEKKETDFAAEVAAQVQGQG